MAENKQYITQVQENGNVMISEEVIEAIVAQTISEVEGVHGLDVKPGADIADLRCIDNLESPLSVPDCNQSDGEHCHCVYLLLPVRSGNAAVLIGRDYHFAELGDRQYDCNDRPHPSQAELGCIRVGIGRYLDYGRCLGHHLLPGRQDSPELTGLCGGGHHQPAGVALRSAVLRSVAD